LRINELEKEAKKTAEYPAEQNDERHRRPVVPDGFPHFFDGVRRVRVELRVAFGANVLDRVERYPEHRMELPELLKFHELYERASADLAKIETFAGEPEIRRFLEGLVARAYSEIHETREKRSKLSLWRWFVETFPRAFRRHPAVDERQLQGGRCGTVAARSSRWAAP